MPEYPLSAAVPRGFYCEHTQAKSRVYALIAPWNGPETLKAILTCTDPELAQRAASLLSVAWNGGEETAVRTKADRLLELLPSAPAGSLRQSLEHAFSGQWPDPGLPQLSTHLMAEGWGTGDDDESQSHSSATTDYPAHSQSASRLTDLPGKVVRVTSLLELHVHEPKRLLTTARATGWEPLLEEDDADPDDLVGAVMHMTQPPAIPGTDEVGNEASGQMLRPKAGDELVDWSSLEVTGKFSSGWQLQQPSEPLHPKETLWGTIPDFAKTFPVTDCGCDRQERTTCGSWALTPRTAEIIYSSLSSMADFAYDDIEGHADDPVISTDNADWGFFDRLPRITWGQAPKWRRNMARACDDLAADIAAGRLPAPRCFAEELALHLVFHEEAAATLEEMGDLDDESHDSLPAHRDDYDWDACADELFQDSDILLLYQPELDGVEGPDAELNRSAGIGDMRPANWFTPFDNVAPRALDRGFRR